MATESLTPATVGLGAAVAQRARRVDGTALATWILAGGLTLYLGLDGGGYDIIVRSQAGLVVWWLVLVGAILGLLPTGRLTRPAWAALALFAGLVAWTALATTWSLSSERSLQELSRVAAYLGVLVLALVLHRDRRHALRNTVSAVAAAIVVVVVLALISRLFPDAFPSAHTTAVFLPGARARLAWPLNYWNALAALVAIGLPLLLALATSARTLAVQTAAAAAVPLLVLCDYLTFSRGGAIASGVAVLAFLALAPQRLPKLPVVVIAAAGGAALIAETLQRSAIENGLSGPAAVTQGRQLALWCLLISAAAGLGPAAVDLATRRWPGGWIRISPARARGLLGAAVVAALVVALALGAPSRLDHAWQQFKTRDSTAVRQISPTRYGALSGEGRYDYWRIALSATRGERLTGSGPGTFQLLWLPRAPFPSYAVNAHSLYVETLAELGVVGLALLGGFLALVLVAAMVVVARSRAQTRTLKAGATGALLAFAIAATVDWVWQMPVLPVAVLLLAAALLAPARWRPSPPRPRLALRAALLVAAVGCLVAIGVPLATAGSVRQSQAASVTGNTGVALADARSAARLEPGAASPELQEALVLELGHNLPAAVTAAQRATRDEPANWQTWFVLSRLQAEAGHARAAVQAYRRARADNPQSSVFR